MADENFDIPICQKKYLTSEDLISLSPGVKLSNIAVSVKINGIYRLDKEDLMGKESKDVVFSFDGRKKKMRVNKTNQWAMALLTGECRKSSKWVGLTILLGVDIDKDMETKGAITTAIRIVGCIDASPERQAAFKDAWNNGNRQNGSLAKRLCKKFRSMLSSDDIKLVEGEQREISEM